MSGAKQNLADKDLAGKDLADKDDEPGRDELRPQLIKLGLEIGPLVVFFLANAYGARFIAGFGLGAVFPQPIFFATAVFMAAMVISLALSGLILKRVAVMPLVSGVIVMIFGGLTLWLQDETFIKMKPTIVNILFGGTLLGGLAFGKLLLKYVFGDVYRLKEAGWRVLTWRWGAFFLVLAVLNEIVWRNFSTDLWVAFKVWGIAPLTVVFSFAQLGVLGRYALTPEKRPDAATAAGAASEAIE
ncbi:MAG TPA: septation protein A [Devosiaceae bacterium]|nr:septation protein A [Devosiaceae bacterium]